jgi:hypothetical protein
MPFPRRSPDDQVTATFLRGLTIGALVGAVIAGSSMLSRRRRAAANDPDLPAAPTAPDVSPVPIPRTASASIDAANEPGTRRP